RGVPFDADGWFSLALFTDFSARPPVGILDGYTIAVGAFSVLVLLAHGAAFVALRTGGALRERCMISLRRTLTLIAIGWPLVTWATAVVRPGFFDAFFGRPAAWLAIAVAIAGYVTAFTAPGRARYGVAFAGTTAFIVGLLLATAICAYP